MEVTEKLARYIIALQSIADMECGTDEEDIVIRNELEETFPVLKKEREVRVKEKEGGNGH